MPDLWLTLAKEGRKPSRRLTSSKKSSAMPDLWLAVAEEERPASSSSFPPLSDRAAARASRPRPWVQSQTRVKSQTLPTSKADTDLAASITAIEGRRAARRDERRRNAAAQKALDKRYAETRRKFAVASHNRRQLRTGLNQPPDFSHRLGKLERLANDMAEQRKSPPFPCYLSICLLTVS